MEPENNNISTAAQLSPEAPFVENDIIVILLRRPSSSNSANVDNGCQVADAKSKTRKTTKGVEVEHNDCSTAALLGLEVPCVEDRVERMSPHRPPNSSAASVDKGIHGADSKTQGGKPTRGMERKNRDGNTAAQLNPETPSVEDDIMVTLLKRPSSTSAANVHKSSEVGDAKRKRRERLHGHGIRKQ